MADTKALTEYQQGVLAEKADEIEKIKKLEAFMGTDEWLALGSAEHNRIVFKLGARNETLKVIDKQIEAFDEPLAE
ncbi:hypothetical protein [Pseudomonas sp. WMBT8]|uniref:hypothetical protein n=1 Tax=Pseudomonas sp. WMBT8 TaxID=3414496 RepID=UPI003D800270